MSQINFDRLISERPALSRALTAIRSWLDERKPVRSFALDRLAWDRRDIPPAELVAALDTLVLHHYLSPVYRVIDPNGTFVATEFNSLDSIPPRLPDRFERYFDTREAEVVPAYKLEATSG